MTTLTDFRQRFFVEQSPVRGDIVKLTNAYHTIIAQKNYPTALQKLLGEMLVSASLLIGTLKIEGRLSIQLQSDGNTLLNWAMAECDHTGAVRGLADFKDTFNNETWDDKRTSDDAFAQLGQQGAGVLFINIHPATGESYQGIVERVSDNLGACLAHYQKQSAQIATLIRLSVDAQGANGLLVQLLPQSEQDKENDPDLWDRMTALTQTLSNKELNELPANEILYRLYHEEEVVMPDATPLHFGCTCSIEKSEAAILQLGLTDALNSLNDNGQLVLDCGFCGTMYSFNETQLKALFE